MFNHQRVWKCFVNCVVRVKKSEMIGGHSHSHRHRMPAFGRTIFFSRARVACSSRVVLLEGMVAPLRRVVVLAGCSIYFLLLALLRRSAARSRALTLAP